MKPPKPFLPAAVGVCHHCFVKNVARAGVPFPRRGKTVRTVLLCEACAEGWKIFRVAVERLIEMVPKDPAKASALVDDDEEEAA